MSHNIYFHIISFNNCHIRSFLVHKKKFNWLKNKKVSKYINNIKPIDIQYVLHKETLQSLDITQNCTMTTTNKTDTYRGKEIYKQQHSCLRTHKQKMVHQSFQYRHSP